ncbi:hypothetical protein H0H87_012224 [Tephrocybe sp. NHM501043]|nr:hypothetical protein H0H87_012224 [Tephrocybe sp. NHM501043]
MMVNAMLGTILWGTYAEAFSILESHTKNHPTLTAGLAGGIAGGAQAVLAAPAENMRILFEGGSGGHSWSNAWKEVFRGTGSKSISKKADIEDIRQLRSWMKDVGDMAGRGWNGWRWGLGKDICVTRRVALQVKDTFHKRAETPDAQDSVWRQLPHILHGFTLVGGGVLAGLADINKPVLEFDEFMKLPGCTEADRHTSEAVKVEAPKPTSTTSFSLSDSGSGKETYSSAGSGSIPTPSPAPVPAPVVVEDDDVNVAVAPGTPCRRNGCNVAFVSDAMNRQGNGEETLCTYHPAPVSIQFQAPMALGADTETADFQRRILSQLQGYLCCKRRVLEFDEFLKIGGCQTGRHLFSPPKTLPSEEEVTTCRVDHYQTVEQVHVSIFAKKADKERSTVEFEEEQVKFDIYLPGPKKFSRTLNLFGPIDPKQSSYQIFGTKVELHLQKRDGRSWTLLEKTSHDIGNISLTFGVGGKTGTIGAKNVILDDVNKARVLANQ